MVKTFLGSVLLLAALQPANAHAQQRQVNVFWFEDATCVAWTKSAGNKLLRLQYEFWVRGFASGHNYANPSRQVTVGKLPGGDGLYAHLDQYCRENPESSFIGGAIRLIEQLREPLPAVPGKKESAKSARENK